MQPDYARYTEEQLLDVQRHIDRERYPERAEEIDSLLSTPETLAEARANQQKLDRERKAIQRQNRKIVLSILPIIIGALIGMADISPSFAGNALVIYHVPVHYFAALALVFIGTLSLQRFIAKGDSYLNP